MEIKSSYEILIDLLGRGSYSLIYVEQNFPMPLASKGLSIPLNSSESIEIILSSAVSGSGGVGFYHSPISPRSDVELRGIALFITTKLPKKVDIPVIFCRSVEHLLDRFTLAVKLSEEFKIPVLLCCNENSLNNFISVDSVDCSIERVSSFITQKTFDNLNSVKNLDKFESIYHYLLKYFKEHYEGDGNISFYGKDGRFLKFFVPYFSDFSNISGCIVNSISEYLFFKNNNSKQSFDIKFEPNNESVRLCRDILCPGCPFIIIHKNINLKDKILTTDVNCPSVRRIFGYVDISIEKVIGLTLNKPNSNLFYVGKLSNVNNKLLSMMKNIEFIFLNDGTGLIDLPVVSKISKFKTSNVVFPYSCNNISKSSPIKVNTKKCVCFKKNESPHCVSGTLCPALQEMNGAMSINEKLCVGCRLCETSCPYGAI